MIIGSYGSGKVAQKLGLEDKENEVDESKMTDAERYDTSLAPFFFLFYF